MTSPAPPDPGAVDRGAVERGAVERGAVEPDVFDEIRAACAAVAGRAHHVWIDEDRLAAFAATLAAELDADVDDDPGHVPLADAEATAAFVVALDAINFGSGWFPHLRKRPGRSGYHTVAAAFREHVEAEGPPTVDRLAAMTTERCLALFDQPPGGPAEELMAHFAAALRDLGGFVDRVGGGSFLGVVEAADHSATRMVTMLAEMPAYRDVHRHRGLLVPLYKRAQITPFDLSVAFGGQGPGRFDDLHRLTMFADNLVPHVLRVDGVLRFDDDLLARIEAEQDIPSGSEPEVEIRAVGLHAVERLVALLGPGRPGLTAGRLDGVLWRRGGRPRYKAVPRHRSRCVFY